MKQRFLILGLSLVTVSVVIFSLSLPIAHAQRRPNPAPFPPLRRTDRLTIIAPHPDDETIALGGLIYRARQQHIQVSVIVMTNGDSNKESPKVAKAPISSDAMIALGKDRQQEAIKALADLGVPESSVYFLSLPDEGLTALLSPAHLTQPYTSQTTGLSGSGAYDDSYVKNLAYTGQAAQAALLSAVNATHPTRVFVTMRDDHHPDHWAAGQFFENIRTSIKGNPAHYSYLVHYPKFSGLPHTTETPLLPPDDLKNKLWDTIQLTPKEEAEQAAAIQEYKSQLGPDDVHDSITNFTRPNELVIQ